MEFSKSQLSAFTPQADALEQEVLKQKTQRAFEKMGRCHIYFYVQFQNFKLNMRIWFGLVLSFNFWVIQNKEANCSKEKRNQPTHKAFWGMFGLQMKKTKWNRDFPMFLKGFLCQKINFCSLTISLCRRIICLTFAASFWPLCLI